MLERRANIQTDFFLWQLFHIDEQIVDKEEDIHSLRQQFEEFEKNLYEKADALKSAKKKASAARRATTSADKARLKINTELDKLQPTTIKLTEEIKNLSRQVTSDNKKVVKVEKEAEEHKNTLLAFG